MSEGHVPTHPTAVARKPIRVAQVLPWPNVGGTEVATLRLATAVRARGIESVALGVGSNVTRLFKADGFEATFYRPVEPSYRHPREFLRATWHLARCLRRLRVDLVDCADILAAYHAGLAGRLAGIPVICHVRNRYTEISRRDRGFLRPIQRFVFVSEDTRRQFDHPVPDHRAFIVYDGIDVPEAADSGPDRRSVARELGIPQDAPIVGMVARVAPQKDYFTLVRAAARLRTIRPDIRFLIVGDHSSTPAYQTHCREIRTEIDREGLSSNFIFTDARNDVQRLLRALDVFVLSTHMEGLPLVILEAMAQARAVVATAVDGVPEVVSDGETGFLHAHEDDEGLAGHIARLLHDPDLRARLGEAGRAAVRERFSPERFGHDMAAVYRRTLGLQE